MDIEDFLRDDIAIEEYTSESDPIDDFCWFIGTDSEAPECEEDDNRVDYHRKIREWNIKYHRIRMDDNACTRNSSIDIAATMDRDSLDRMEKLVGLCTEVDSVSESDNRESEDDDIFFLHIKRIRICRGIIGSLRGKANTSDSY